MRRCSRWPRRQVACHGETSKDNENEPQRNRHFQICLNIIEARRLIWNHPQWATSYVVVGYGKKRRRTCVRKHMVEPCYREGFIFETYKSLKDLENSSIWLAVMEPRCCAPTRLLGEANIDLRSIWAQPNHQVNQKWIQLSLPTGSVGSVGFLKIDVSIVCRGDIHMQVMPGKRMGDNIMTNLQPNTGFEQQKANYQITISAAFGLAIGDRRYHGRLPNTLVRVSFCGLVGKTSVRYRDHSPVYSELISIVEMFPNTDHTICIEVCGVDGLITRVLGTTHLDLGLVSHDGDNGFLPTFGPSLLHMYGSPYGTPTEADSPFNQGALLVSLKTAVPFDKQKLRSVNVEPITPVNMDTIWVWEEFCIYCPILEVSMVESWLEAKCCGVSITIGETFNQYGGGKADGDEFIAMLTEIRSRKLNHMDQCLTKSSDTYSYFDLSEGFPVLQLAVKLPDFRFRMFRNNMVERIVVNLSDAIVDAELRLKGTKCECLNNIIEDLNKAADDTATDIVRFLDAINTDEIMGHPTELDVKQLTLMEEEMEKIYKELPTKHQSCDGSKAVVTKKKIKEFLTELKCVVDNLKSLINQTPHGWPHIIVWLTSGGTRIAYHKVSPHNILYSSVPEQKGINADTMRTIYLKPLKCFRHQNGCSCVSAKIELQLWMGLYKQYYAFEESLPPGYRIKLRGYNIFLRANPMIYECRVFLYNAKLNYVIENSFTNIFARVHIMNKVSQTKIQPKSMSPIWNQVLKIHIETFTTQQKVEISPPEATVDVCESHSSGKENLIGRIRIRPVVDDRQCYEYAPKLQIYDLCSGSEQVGTILMSVQLVQIPEKLVKTTLYNSPLEECYYLGSSKEINICGNYNIAETLPNNLLPQIATYKIDIYWWGLRDLNITKKPCVMLEINNLTVKSDVLYVKHANCNFSHQHTSHVFEAPLSEPYCPPLSIRLCDSNTFGRTQYLGTNVVKDPKKFLVDWIPKSERENLVKGMSVKSQMFCEVNQVLHVVTNRKQDCHNKVPDTDISVEKISKWRKFIRKKRQPKEEEYTLLPMFDIDKDEMKMNKRCCERTSQRENWWLRYFSSQNHLNDADSNLDKIMIYPSELENQPEFSKFRDWCSNLKFYNRTKSDHDVRDNQGYCGSLKAGIAIYNWPPPEHTVAVSTTGVDLKEGYFSDGPANDVAKFLVRVYLLKVLNIASKDNHDKNCPSVVISFGKKRFEDRHRRSQSTDCSIIGEMYELRCTLPEDYLLTLSLYDCERGSSEDLIGKTAIDLEDRIYTKHRACVGLSPKYNLLGASKWRDSLKPSAILEDICDRNHLPKPSYPDSCTVIANGVEYKNDEMQCVNCSSVLSSEGKENICLNILHQWHTLPICGYHLVPEHVETRTLYRPDKPGVRQGQILMWIDIFPFDIENIPPPIDITPPKAEEYELRIVIWDVNGLKINNRTKNGLEVYARGSIGCCDQAQSTDVCYGVTSKANFNWRMVFRFFYEHAEKKLILKEKGPYTEYEERLSPNFKIQIIDNQSEGVLATLTLNLNSFPRGTKLPQLCLRNSEEHKKVNLFLTRSIKAWWPMQKSECEGNTVAGSIHLEMTLLPKKQADLIPVGLGRGPPSPLPDPQGRETSRHLMDYLCGQDSYSRRNMIKLLLLMLTLITLSYLIVHVDFFVSSIQDLFDDTGPYDGESTKLHPVD